jgi:uncharacterized protein (TIGR02757 family)
VPRRSREARAEGDAARLDAVGSALARVCEACDLATRREKDPVRFVHRYDDPHDRELVALLASSLAFGNAKAFSAKIDDALTRLGPSPARAAERPDELSRLLAGWKHRLYQGADVACMLAGARAVQREHGTLGEALAALIAREGDLIGGLAALTELVRGAGGLSARTTRGARHLLPDPLAGGTSKRLLLLVRWMARPADGVDLGMWPIDPARLLIPLDVHLFRLSKNLGFTTRASPSLRAALDVTQALGRYDPADPTKYDFALCHLGMARRCPSRADDERCDGCGIRDVCVHWSSDGTKARKKKLGGRSL